ncbi:hypothetical protein JKP88DRAFT_319329 [Tribonema minus]|uniref:Uncharacterized protein n=1 Tax=Tribonema minus TaxID=303371 RepID=A0A836CD91_9STRA|nr:hypothetical protein JKP88DRAFT_319329 [Tribonema minus]
MLLGLAEKLQSLTASGSALQADSAQLVDVSQQTAWSAAVGPTAALTDLTEQASQTRVAIVSAEAATRTAPTAMALAAACNAGCSSVEGAVSALRRGHKRETLLLQQCQAQLRAAQRSARRAIRDAVKQERFNAAAAAATATAARIESESVLRAELTALHEKLALATGGGARLDAAAADRELQACRAQLDEQQRSAAEALAQALSLQRAELERKAAADVAAMRGAVERLRAQVEAERAALKRDFNARAARAQETADAQIKIWQAKAAAATARADEGEKRASLLSIKAKEAAARDADAAAAALRTAEQRASAAEHRAAELSAALDGERAAHTTALENVRKEALAAAAAAAHARVSSAQREWEAKAAAAEAAARRAAAETLRAVKATHEAEMLRAELPHCPLSLRNDGLRPNGEAGGRAG